MKDNATFDLRRDAARRGVLLVAHRGVWGGNVPPNTIVYDYKTQLVAGRSDDRATAGGDPEGSWGWLADLTSETIDAYTRFLVSLAKPLAESASHPQVIMRSPFWRNDAKAACTAKAAEQVGATYVDAGFLGADKTNTAAGLFEHQGVANHPGDLGMRRLADLILAAIKTPMPKNIKPKNITFIQGAQHSYVPPKPWQTGERRK